MRQFLLGLILGLLAVVHSTPVTPVTQHPAATDEDFLHNVMTDGFLVDRPSTASPLKHSLQTGATSEPTRPSDFTAEGSGEAPVFDFSGDGADQATTQNSSTDEVGTSATTPSAEMSSTTFPTLDVDDGSGEEVSSTTTPDLSLTTTVATTTAVPTTTHGVTCVDRPMGRMLPGGSDSIPTTMEMKVLVEEAIKPVVAADTKLENSGESQEPINKGHSTPDWVIILGFMVGLAALVGLLAAIVNRDKWLKTKDKGSPDADMNMNNQKKEQEMDVFLPQKEPIVEAKNGEYTVIPLDDASEKNLLN